MSNNTEFLKSLSDKQLADEIKYGRELAESRGHHREHARRELDEAISEKQRREPSQS